MTTTGKPLHLHSLRRLRRTYFNRAFAAAYSLALSALLYRHLLELLRSTNFISISLLLSDLVLSFMWLTFQTFRLNMVAREVHLENLEKAGFEFPAMDIFVCTADPYKEPPVNVVNTALSVMAYDYPPEKLSVYVSDDGGSELTLFAFMEAAEFARFWVPFCRENNVVDRCPEVFFRSKNYSASDETLRIEEKYEEMTTKIANVMEKGMVAKEAIMFANWKQTTFTPQDHPPIIEVLLESLEDKDISGGQMPNLIYVSREKNKASPHHFKAGALNALLRVSAVMTNAPIILTLDCDTFSNSPKTPKEILCLLMGHPAQPKHGYVQYPQLFRGINKADIYGSEFILPFQVNPTGMDGFRGPIYVGTGCFFRRRALFGGPDSMAQPEIPELRPDSFVEKPIKSQGVMNLAHHVVGCNYEDQTTWGTKIGFKYGSLTEDFYTSFRLQCEGWHSMFYTPKRPAFLGDMPISLSDNLSQSKRWFIGFLEVVFSKYSPLTYGAKAMGILEAWPYAHYALWPVWSIPITIYAFVPQLTLLAGSSIFPKVSDPWFFLYTFLFLGAYGRNCAEFLMAKSTVLKWWNDQRFWLIRGLTSQSFATMEYLLKFLGIPTQGFNVTSKVVDDEQGKRYNEGKFEFGVPNPMFVPLSMAAILNLMAFVYGVLEVFVLGKRLDLIDSMFLQMFVSGFGVLNSLPIYEAMFLRRDKGRMPTEITMVSVVLTFALYLTSLFVLNPNRLPGNLAV